MTLKERRKAAGLTQQQVADALGIDQASVSLWENGKFKPLSKRLDELAKLYNCSVEELKE